KMKSVSAAGDKMVGIGTKFAAAGAAMGAMAMFPVKEAASFERQMSRVLAVTGGAEESFVDLNESAKELGRTTQFSAVQAGEGMRFLGMAGLNAKEVLSAIQPALSLAAAGELEVGEAADYATNIMSTMGLQVEDLTHIMDVMAYTAANSNTDVRQLAEAMTYVALDARSAKIPLEQVSAYLGVMAKNGIQASRAGTSLRAVIASLIRPLPKAQKELEKLGVEISKTSDGGLDLAKTLDDLGKAGMTTSQSYTIFKRVAGGVGTALARSTKEIGAFSDALFGPEAQGAAL
ncbi:unnamed protein product, partial [marine sediment metagenome]